MEKKKNSKLEQDHERDVDSFLTTHYSFRY